MLGEPGSGAAFDDSAYSEPASSLNRRSSESINLGIGLPDQPAGVVHAKVGQIVTFLQYGS